MKYTFLILLSFMFTPSPVKDKPVYTKAELIGDFNPARHDDFEELRSKYTTKEEAYLREEVYDAFKDMWKDARRDDINLVIISATRWKRVAKSGTSAARLIITSWWPAGSSPWPTSTGDAASGRRSGAVYRCVGPR